MKKFKRLLVAALGTLVLAGTTGCSVTYSTSYIYENGDKYTAGDRDISEKIDTINIDYMSGDITFTGEDTNKISIKETSGKSLDDKQKVHTWVDGSTLYVRYAESAKNLDLNNLNKKLEISIPKDVKLSELEFGSSSGDFSGTDFEVDKLDMTVSSGDIDVDCIVTDARLTASSGSVGIEANGACDKIDVTTSSGRINVIADDLKSINSTASSGDGSFTFKKAPAELDIEASSGGVEIYVPVDSGITADVDRSSGDFDYELAFSNDGGKYTCGNGECKWGINTSSGDIRIKKIAE